MLCREEVSVRRINLLPFVWLLLAALGAVGCSSGSGSPPAKPTTNEDDFGPVADFTLTERSGRTIRCQDLRGKVWVASFLFTRCCTGCPRISADLLELQKNLPEGVAIVSFSVDPEYDTPPVLKAYADTLGADPKRWLFLTGKQSEIYHLIKDSFGPVI